eukprot:3940885-Rhodomonas_salina.1
MPVHSLGQQASKREGHTDALSLTRLLSNTYAATKNDPNTSKAREEGRKSGDSAAPGGGREGFLSEEEVTVDHRFRVPPGRILPNP